MGRDFPLVFLEGGVPSTQPLGTHATFEHLGSNLSGRPLNCWGSTDQAIVRFSPQLY